MNIAGREISSKLPPYVIAEISCNHCGDLNLALQLIKAAKDAGADAAKLQCYEADDLTIDCNKSDFVLKGGLWKGRNLYELYSKAQTPRAWFPRLFEEGRNLGITVISSVFSPAGVDFLETLDCPAYKIASMEITDIPLIEYASSTGKPLIISTGMATKDEKWDLRGHCLLHCVSGYPTPIEDADLDEFDWLKFHNYGGQTGISDHTLGWDVPVAATVLGAQLLEKHLKLRNTEPEDAAFSLYPYEFAVMVKNVKAIWHAMQPSERKSEEASRQLRRSLYVVKDIKQGEQFTEENVRSIRPAYGLAPKELPRVLKSYAGCNIERGTALDEGMLMPF